MAANYKVNVHYNINKNNVAKGFKEVKVAGKEAFQEANTGIGKLMSGLKGLYAPILGLVGTIGLLKFGKSALESWDAWEDSIIKTESAINSTGSAANRTLMQLTSTAKELAGKTLFKSSEIMDAESMLLTFTKIKDVIFDETMPAILNFASRYKMSAVEASLAIGKAMNDPLKGIQRLQRQGVVFSDVQKAQIENYMKMGRVQDAQRVILKELNTEFGGLAENLAKADSQKLFMLGKRLGSIKREFGQFIDITLNRLAPLFNSLIDGATNLWKWLQGNSTSMQAFKYILITVISVWTAYNAIMAVAAIRMALVTWWQGASTTVMLLNILATEGLGAAWTFLNAAILASPIGWIVAGVMLVVGAFMVLWDKVAGFRAVLGGAWAGIKQFLTVMVQGFLGLGKILKDVFTLDFKALKTDGLSFINNLKDGLTIGMVDAVKKGSEAARNSDFKFGNLLKRKKGVQNPNEFNGISSSGVSGDLTGGGNIAEVADTSLSTSTNYKQVTINITKMVETFNVNTTNMQEAPVKIKEMLQQALSEVLADSTGIGM